MDFVIPMILLLLLLLVPIGFWLAGGGSGPARREGGPHPDDARKQM